MLQKIVIVGLCISALCRYPLAWAEDKPKPDDGKWLFETYCSACHTLMLPRSQHLDRSNWEWVVDDMINQFGCNLTEEQQKLIIDYLVENLGPNSK